MNAILLGAALVISAPALKDRPKKKPDLVGEWKVEAVTLPGRTTSTSTGLRYTFTADGKWLIHRDGQELVGHDRGYAADPAATPPTLELIANTAAAQPARRAGIFRVEGDTLTICAAQAGAARPTRFEPAEGVTVYVLKRVKPKD